MATAAKVGSNFTGVQMSPKDTKRLLDAVNEIHPDVPGDERGMLVERTERAAEADRIAEDFRQQFRTMMPVRPVPPPPPRAPEPRSRAPRTGTGRIRRGR